MPGIPPNSLFSVFAFIGFLLAGLPLHWHMQSWNTGTCMYMLWTSLGCLILFINSVVWNDNVVNWAPVWCDITSHYLLGGGIGIPASSLCITRRLYYITKLQRVSVGRKEKRREIMVDVSIGIGFPCVVMALSYVVQGRRFAIYEQIGCFNDIVNTLPAYFLLHMWPLAIGLISLIYAVLTFRRAFQQKRRLKELLNLGFSIDHRRYWCLMALCSMEVAFTVPLSLYVIILATFVDSPVPYVSWAWIHADFSQIRQYPTVVWQSVPYVAASLESTRWFYVLCAFVIFAFFGWAQEARDFYRQAFWSVCRRLGYSKPTSPSSLPTTFSKRKQQFTCTGRPSLPVHDVDQQMRSTHRIFMPAQARVRRHSVRTSLSFEAPPRPRSESLSSSLRHNVGEGSTENSPRLHPLSDLDRHTHISWTSMPAAPEPALAIDHGLRTRTSVN